MRMSLLIAALMLAGCAGRLDKGEKATAHIERDRNDPCRILVTAAWEGAFQAFTAKIEGCK